MIENGTVIKSDSGAKYRVGKPMASGGQADVYAATDRKTGKKGALKVFHKEFSDDISRERTRFLVDADFHSLSGVFCAPVDPITGADCVGHFSPLAPGKKLRDLIESGDLTLQEACQLALAITVPIQKLHENGMGHGDIHANNVLVHRNGSVLEVSLIDLDNFWAPGAPPPRCAGQYLYMAPELREALEKKRTALPNEQTELFAVAVGHCLTLLLKHPAQGTERDPKLFKKAMAGGWRFDPARGYDPHFDDIGYPSTVLNSGLMALMRAGLSPHPGERPTAAEWSRELLRCVRSVSPCPLCDGPAIVDSSKTRCPFCKKPYPHLTLQTASGNRIHLADVTTHIGRKHLGGSPKVSKYHAVFRRIGPETTVESIGMNGTGRWNSTHWERLNDGEPVYVSAGDRLLFADIETQIVAT